jgi:ribosomal protein S18 acetylase RimI-like enzyme
MTDLVIRPLAAGEEQLFLSMKTPARVGMGWAGRDYAAVAAAGQYRPEWTWIALRGDHVVGRAAWWGGPDEAEPLALDWFDFDGDVEVGAALLREAGFAAEYCLVLPPGWRDDPAVRAEADIRIAAAEHAGMRPLVERFNYLWTSGGRLPNRPGRLRFRAEPDDDVVAAVMARCHIGTLDVRARSAADAQEAAREELEFLRWMPSPREWWRLAFTPEGDLAGVAVPGRNHTRPVIGFIGVIPEWRGHGYGYDLLVEATRLLADEGADEIGADTDVSNGPMAAAFWRAGYPVIQQRLFLRYP